MSLRDLVRRNRSYRRFHPDVPVDRASLEELVDLARLTASARNLQPLKYYLSWSDPTNELIFASLTWAGYLKDWPGPNHGERPVAYILILGDSRLGNSFDYDAGIAAQTMLLGAVEAGLGGCMVGSIRRKQLGQQLTLSPDLEILLALALGKPAEEIHLEKVAADGDIRYWRDAEGIHHVPKRDLCDLIVN